MINNMGQLTNKYQINPFCLCAPIHIARMNWKCFGKLQNKPTPAYVYTSELWDKRKMIASLATRKLLKVPKCKQITNCRKKPYKILTRSNSSHFVEFAFYFIEFVCNRNEGKKTGKALFFFESFHIFQATARCFNWIECGGWRHREEPRTVDNNVHVIKALF